MIFIVRKSYYHGSHCCAFCLKSVQNVICRCVVVVETVLVSDHPRTLGEERDMRRTMTDVMAQVFLIVVLCGVVTSVSLLDYDDERKQT